MKMTMKYIGLMTFVLILFFSCSASRLGRKADGELNGKKKEMSEDFDPLILEDDDIVVVPEEADSVPEKNLRPDNRGNTGSLSDTGEKEMVQGFRVQLLATKDEIGAREEKKKAIFILQGEDVYLDFESPNYKLRVGNCLTRKEAEELRERIIQIARQKHEREWERAWIVRTRVEKMVHPN
jgi:hypothetical protein